MIFVAGNFKNNAKLIGAMNRYNPPDSCLTFGQTHTKYDYASFR